MTNPHVMILAGEASGDDHAAEFVEVLRQLKPELRISGMGSDSMKRAGVDIFFDSKSYPLTRNKNRRPAIMLPKPIMRMDFSGKAAICIMVLL